MTRIRYFTQATMDNLHENVAEHLDWYYAPQGNDFPGQVAADSWREARMEAEPLATQLTSGLKERRHECVDRLHDASRSDSAAGF